MNEFNGLKTFDAPAGSPIDPNAEWVQLILGRIYASMNLPTCFLIDVGCSSDMTPVDIYSEPYNPW